MVSSAADCAAANHPHEGSGEAHQPTVSAGRRPTIPMRGQEMLGAVPDTSSPRPTIPMRGQESFALGEVRHQDGPTIPMRGQEAPWGRRRG